MISITNIARNQVIKLMKKDGYSHNSDFVRVGVNSGGCSGLSYELKFDNKTGDNDKVFVDNEIKIIVDKKSLLYLMMLGVDFPFCPRLAFCQWRLLGSILES